MSADRTPEDRTSGLTGGPDAAGDAGVSARIDPGSGDGSVLRDPRRERAPWLQSLAGLAVRGSDDRPVGRVRDVYQQDAGGALAAIAVLPRQLSTRTVLIPAAAIEAVPPLGEDRTSSRPDGETPAKDDVIRLRIDSATARAGKRPPEIGHVAPQDLREAAEALGLDSADPARRDSASRCDSAAGTGTDGGSR